MYYIGIDLGGTSIKAGLVNEEHEIVLSLSKLTRNEREAKDIIMDMVKLCEELIEAHHITLEDIRSIGIGCPGLVQSEEGIVLSSSNLNFNHVAVRKLFNEQYNVPVYIDNDANCAALGETLAGAAKDAASVLVITLGTGVGGGIIMHNEIYTGAYFGAGEIGHQVINFHETEACGCGRKGCYEQYASASALVRQAKMAAKESPESLLNHYAENQDIEAINGKTIFAAAKAGDEVASKVLMQYYEYVACGATNLINILEPEVLVIGGGISAQGDYIVKPIEEAIKRQMYGGLKLNTKIKAATLGNDAGIIGAALLEMSKAHKK